ncbi:MAG: hypothetical protein Q4Q19_06920 [Methanobrevibacter sp.]|uniref:hypothetical protein n=1 Tax=Methanobrevibacter sp. TaxID=66852 RepID=UPI00270C9C6B|nr:hypothetical protein [Methanobrevibacter sp.]MDO5827973.1 hypothetical protein [Methanobrevibacter sp.]MEE0935701.1 hypothetical protein [Methanobrevibacter sp.]MEE1128353.1 hypothetical protein [Methanobrevibacter sp.]
MYFLDRCLVGLAFDFEGDFGLLDCIACYFYLNLFDGYCSIVNSSLSNPTYLH